MKLFRRRVKDDVERFGFEAKFRNLLEQRQRSLAGWLSRRTQHWNRSSWLVALFLFCLLFGGGCLLLVINAINYFK